MTTFLVPSAQHRVVADIRKRYAGAGGATPFAVRLLDGSEADGRRRRAARDARRDRHPAGPGRAEHVRRDPGRRGLPRRPSRRRGRPRRAAHPACDPHRPAPAPVRGEVRPPAAARPGPQRRRVHRAPLRERPGLLPVLPRPSAPGLLPGRLRAPRRAAGGRHHPQARLRARRDRRGSGRPGPRHRWRVGSLRRVRRAARPARHVADDLGGVAAVRAGDHRRPGTALRDPPRALLRPSARTAPTTRSSTSASPSTSRTTHARWRRTGACSGPAGGSTSTPARRGARTGSPRSSRTRSSAATGRRCR